MIRLKSVTIYTDTANGEKELITYTENRLFDPKQFAQVAAETNRKYSRMHPGAGIHMHMRDESTEMSDLAIDKSGHTDDPGDLNPYSDCCKASVIFGETSQVCLECGSLCNPVYKKHK